MMAKTARLSTCFLIGFILAQFITQPLFQATSKKASRHFVSATEFTGKTGVYRWKVKTETDKPPKDALIIPVTAQVMGTWDDLEVHMDSPRQGNEHNWYSLTGKVVLVKAEDDGDLHIQIANRYGAGSQVVVEVPAGSAWDDIRKEVFSWANVRFPCEAHKLNLTKHPVITVVGRAFYDGQHRNKDKKNRRSEPDDVAVWEIHPDMSLEVEK